MVRILRTRHDDATATRLTISAMATGELLLYASALRGQELGVLVRAEAPVDLREGEESDARVPGSRSADEHDELAALDLELTAVERASPRVANCPALAYALRGEADRDASMPPVRDCAADEEDEGFLVRVDEQRTCTGPVRMQNGSREPSSDGPLCALGRDSRRRDGSALPASGRGPDEQHADPSEQKPPLHRQRAQAWRL